VKDLLARTFARDAANVLANVAAVRRDDDDAVHQLRVACRRARADLAALKPLIDDPRVPQLRAELRWLGAAFGAVRDLEVLRARLVATAAQPPALDAEHVDELLAAEEQRAQEAARDALDSARCAELLAMLSLPLIPARHPRRHLRLAKRARAKLRSALAELTLESPDKDWHRARILAKRCRYTAEAVDRRGIARKAKRLQEHLGEHQDAVMTITRLQALAQQQPELAELCGCLALRERASANEVRKLVLSAR
jgi:CHAD domain-containing protein